MAAPSVELVEGADRLRVALAPLRRQVLERLRHPASATEVAVELGISRQRANYHVRALEAAGLIELVEERQRRGCIERVMRATADSFLVDPSVLAPPAADHVVAQDRFAAEHLLTVATETVRDVARMQARAEARDERLLTFTIEAELAFAQPADLERFADALAAAVRATADAFHQPGGRRYRIVAGGHPAASADATRSVTADPTLTAAADPADPGSTAATAANEEVPPWTTAPDP